MTLNKTLWKTMQEQNPNIGKIVREVYRASGQRDMDTFASSLSLLLYEAEKIGFARGLLRGARQPFEREKDSR